MWKHSKGLQCVDDTRVFDRPLLYFHNGFAKDLDAAVEFYDTRFNIGFSKQQKSDLVAFLRSL
jgi:cytochrome c peroxidase